MQLNISPNATICGKTIIVVNAKANVSIHERTQFLMQQLGIAPAMEHDNLYQDIVRWVKALMETSGARRQKGLRLWSEKVAKLQWRIKQIERRDARRKAEEAKAAREAYATKQEDAAQRLEAALSDDPTVLEKQVVVLEDAIAKAEAAKKAMFKARGIKAAATRKANKAKAEADAKAKAQAEADAKSAEAKAWIISPEEQAKMDAEWDARQAELKAQREQQAKDDAALTQQWDEIAKLAAKTKVVEDFDDDDDQWLGMDPKARF